jgi:hypothetical protein
MRDLDCARAGGWVEGTRVVENELKNWLWKKERGSVRRGGD